MGFFPDDSFGTESPLTLEVVFLAFGESFFLIFFRGDFCSLSPFAERFPFDFSTLFGTPLPFIVSRPFFEGFEYSIGLSKLV